MKSNHTTCYTLLAVALAVLCQCSKPTPTTEQQATQVIAPDSAAALWYKRSIIYTLDVEVFQDSDHDGVGDFKGLTSRLGYIDSLGVDAIWLSPFQPTPNKDDGYDVADFYTVDPRLGTPADFTAFMDAARRHNIRIIMDLVLNHTSDEHPWFQAARRDAKSPYRDWYIWSKTRPENYDQGMIFPGVQTETWRFDSIAKEYYYHRFYKFQPDLNTQLPAVQAEIRKILKTWLDRGISGFRLDAVPFFIEVTKTEGDAFEHRYDMLTDLRQYVDSLREDAVILGEANVMPEENKEFFGVHGERMEMMFNFYVNQRIFYALASGDAGPLRSALEATQVLPPKSAWGQFLRNHDEVDLGRLSKRERQVVYDKFGPDKSMQLYDRGIRRRLAPMLSNNRKQLELAYSVLFALPSTPVLRYGDEIGMGDDLSLPERMAVRTPMQWTSGQNGGFTDSDLPVQPVIKDRVYGYQRINVATGQADKNSLLRWTAGMVKLRKECPEISYGHWNLVHTGAASVLGLHYHWDTRDLLILLNFSPYPQKLTLSVNTTLTDLRTGHVLTPSDGKHAITLQPYQYQWLRSKP